MPQGRSRRSAFEQCLADAHRGQSAPGSKPGSGRELSQIQCRWIRTTRSADRLRRLPAKSATPTRTPVSIAPEQTTRCSIPWVALQCRVMWKRSPETWSVPKRTTGGRCGSTRVSRRACWVWPKRVFATRILVGTAYLQRYAEVAPHTAAGLSGGVQTENQLGDRDQMSSYGLKLRRNSLIPKKPEYLKRSSEL